MDESESMANMMGVMFYISIGPSVDNGDSIKWWKDYIYSQASSDTGSTVATYSAENAGQTSLENVEKPDVNVTISVYDPEVQALLAYE